MLCSTSYSFRIILLKVVWKQKHVMLFLVKIDLSEKICIFSVNNRVHLS